MRLKPAVLAVLTRGRLSRLVADLGIEDVDPTDQNSMVSRLNRDVTVSPTTVLQYLPSDDLADVLDLLGLPQSTSLDDLRKLASEQDRDDPDAAIETEPEAAPPSEVGHQEPVLDDSVVVGALVSWGRHDLVGVVTEVQGNRVTVHFDNGEERYFARESGILRRVSFATASQVMRLDGTVGIVLERVDGQPYPTWKVWFGDATANVAEIGLRPAVIRDPLERIRSGQLDKARHFNLRSVTADFWLAHQHDALVSLAHARVDLKPHQVFVAHKVIAQYPHRFMLADEVGLGKTIEAAMILKELRARKQARRVLILVPPGLQRQWQFELKSKFNETFSIYTSNTVRALREQGVTNPWTHTDSVITSHSWASWDEKRRREIASVHWDMIIVDEAHHARVHKYGRTIRRTNLYRLVGALVAEPAFSRRAVLFLTATPLQLERYELYSLVEMLNPVLFPSEEEFIHHVKSLAGLNRIVEQLETRGVPSGAEREPFLADVARLLETDETDAEKLLVEDGPEKVAGRLRERHLLGEVLIRNRKDVVGGFQPRSAFRWEVELSEPERQVYDLMQEVLREGYELAEQTGQNAIGFLMVILQKLLASSSRALSKSLRKRQEKAAERSAGEEEVEERLDEDEAVTEAITDLAPQVDDKIQKIGELIALLDRIDVDSKARVLREKLSELFEDEPDAKAIIFTEFRETQDMLAELLGAWGVNLFHGQLTPEQKDAAVEAFRKGSGPQILISTEAGGEGRNFQFCHYLVNYDLPWNPMKVEQRIGRIDRIGQNHPISIFNFRVIGTIEERILEVLERRIKIFEEAVGGLDPILGGVEADIRRALRLSRERRDAELERQGQHLEQEIERAKAAEVKLRDFILQAKSFSSEIAQTILQAESPIKQDEFESFMTELLAWANTYIGASADGERRLMFHPPFSLEHPELFANEEVRRVVFDAGSKADSEYVEYLAFGHPIVDALVERMLKEKHDGAAAVRLVDAQEVEGVRPGWQFNWVIRVGGLRPREFLYPVFVDDAGVADDEIAKALLSASRRFLNEASADVPNLDSLDNANAIANRNVGERVAEELSSAQIDADERAATEEERADALYQHRRRAAEDRIRSCEQTLERLAESEEDLVRRAIPLWQSNLERARAELDAIEEDSKNALVEIARRRRPDVSSELLNVARIEVRQPTTVGS